MRCPRPLALSIAALLLAACSAPPPAPPPPSPREVEGPSGYTTKPGWSARRHAVAAAHPLAAEAGLAMLRDGGSALDAAIAAQMVLGVVEPQASGIGGGAFLMHWDGRRVSAWDGRETAPAAADERQFLRPDGTPMAFAEAAVGGLAVGVPGVVRMLEAAHRAHGVLPWASLFAPAIALADQGFPMGRRLHTQLADEQALRRDPLAGPLFFGADGRPHPVGHRLRNPALAAVLRALAARGSAALHEGEVAADIVRRVRGHPANPGRLSAADLAGYRPVEREPICTPWRVRWRVCGFPPPSSGHLAVMQIAGIAGDGARAAPWGDTGAPAVAWLHRVAEAARLAFADRNAYVADPAFVAAPAGRWTSLLDEAYLRERAALIGPRATPRPAPGRPGGHPLAHAPMAEQPERGTSHLSIVDGAGRAVALTTSVEAPFGARLMSDGGSGLPGGLLLNNQLTDFAFVPADAAGRKVANRVEPGKRPRSSMAPTLVFDAASGRLEMVLGSPGGAAIILYTAQTMLATLEGGVDVQRATELPHHGSTGGPTLLERGRFPAATAEALRALGHEVSQPALTSGVHVLRRSAAGWAGGADPRREGVVAGD